MVFIMKIKVFFVSLACLSCLVPPTLASGLVAKAAVIGAVKGAVVGGIKGAAIGAGVGLAAKGAKALLAKKALLGILLKGAVLKGAALLAAKKAVMKGFGSLAVQGLNGVFNGAMAANEVVAAVANATATLIRSSLTRSDCTPTVIGSPLLQILSGTARVVQTAVRPCEVARVTTSPVVYRVITAPRIVAVPV